MIYVLQVQGGKETQVRDELKKIYCHPMVPTQILTERKNGKVTTRENIIFTGYVFVDTALTLDMYYKIKAVPGVIRFLGGGNPDQLPDSEARYIEWLNNNDKPLAVSEIDAAWQHFISGPIMGYEAYITEINKRQQRVKISVSIMGEPHEISLAATAADSVPYDTDSNPKDDGAVPGADKTAAEGTTPDSDEAAEGTAKTN